MKLTLDREDLKPEFKNINCSQTKFHHFNDEARIAIQAVGKGKFQEYDESNYNVIYSPTLLGTHN